MFATRNAKTLMGAGNWTHFSRAPLDAVIMKASATVDAPAREALLREAGQIALAERPILPLYFGYSTWAMRKTISYAARADSYTLAAEVVPMK
jgi:peptide/nickel transport system substrate-binding protein